MKPPQVSVVMPVYNAERYIAEALESILSQSFKDFEFLVFDDGSTDLSLATIQQYARQDTRIRLLAGQHKGLTCLLNESIQVAQGTYIARMDADDVSLDTRLEEQIEYMKGHPRCVAVGCDLLIIDTAGKTLGVDRHETQPELVEQLLLNGTFGVVTHPASMMRRDALLAIGSYREKFDGLEDFDLLLRLSEVGELSNISKVLFKYRIHERSVCSTKFRIQQRHADTIINQARARRGLVPLKRSIWPLIDPADDEAARLQLWSGCFLGLGNTRIALQYALSALHRQPFTWTSWIALARVLLPVQLRKVAKRIIANGVLQDRHQRRLYTEGEGRQSQSEPMVGMLTVEVTDDWLDELGISLEDFTSRMMGVWYFNYSQALRHVDVGSIFYFVSTKVSRTTRFIHAETGSTFVVLPPPRLYRLLRRWLPKAPQLMAWRFEMRLLDGLSHTIYRGTRFLLRYVSTPIGALFAEMKRDGCEALIVQEYESARFDMCALMGWIKSVPVFGTYQGGLPQSTIFRPFRPLAMRLCAGLLVPARNEATRITKDYALPVTKTSLIYTPVDTATFYPISKAEQRASLGIRRETRVVIYHGQIIFDYKGLDILLEAWERLCRSNPHRDILLMLVGTGRDAVELSHRLSMNKHLKVKWVNNWIRDRREIRRHLASADIYVCPSRGDAFPLAMIEAMACGLPVVASNVNGIADILDDGEGYGGVLVPPGNPDALSQALDKVLLDSTFAQRLGQRARERAISAFSMERIGHQLKALLLSKTSQKHLTPTHVSNLTLSPPSKLAH
jgi:glycosyltransferase involved in cell wall biosynthesis/GT2 family glycosyltransferase